MNNTPHKIMVLKIEFVVYGKQHFCYSENYPTDRLNAEMAIPCLHDTAFIINIDLAPALKEDFADKHYSKINEFLNEIKLLEDEQV